MSAPPASEAERIAQSIRANIVFEHLIGATLKVAALSGAAHFVLSLVARAAGAGISPGGVVTALMGAFSFSAMFFLAGFAASAAIGIPLHLALERANIRMIWPFALAALAVGLGVTSAIGIAPGFAAPWNALYLLPGLAVALLFGRKMRRLWRAAERADVAARPLPLH